MPSGARTERAFTIAELLASVTVAIFLSALLFPALRSVRQKADASRCAAHLRQMALGLRLHANDHLGVLPKTAYGSTSEPTSANANWKWMDAIFPYVRREDLFLCPADRGAKYRPAQSLAPGQSSADYGSYGLNGAYRDPGDSQTPPRSAAYTVTVSMLEDPANTVWVGCTANRMEANGSFGFTWANAGVRPAIVGNPRRLDKLIERHAGRTNVAFCDGHVETLPLDQLAVATEIFDPLDGRTKTVLPRFTIERD